MAKIEQPDIETPNTKYSEVQMTKQANTTNSNATSTNTTFAVQPNANNYATSGKQNNTQPVQQTQNQQSQPVENNIVQSQGSSVVVQRPSDYYDTTVQGYLNAYDEGVKINDYQAQINALTAIDNYRISKGYEPIYAQNIYELTNQRTAKIKRIINDYDNQIAQAANNGDYELAQQIGEQLNAYKRSVNYTDTPDNAVTYLQDTRYKSSYDEIVNGLVGELLTLRFTYDPSDDQALAKAQSHAANVAMEKMNAKGILDSTMTAQVVSSVVSELEPVYRKMAKEEFYENLERLQSMASFVINLEDKQYDRWLNNVKFNLSYYDALKDEMAYQWDRVNSLGYVDNAASIILGVAPGTMSPSMKEAIQKNEYETQKRYDELMSDIALAEAKAQLDVESYAQKQALAAQYDISTYATKQAIKSKYDTTSTNDKEFTGKYGADDLVELADSMKNKYEKKEIIQKLHDNAKSEADYIRALSDTFGYTRQEADNILQGKTNLGNRKYSIEDHQQLLQDLKFALENRTSRDTLEQQALEVLLTTSDMNDADIANYINSATDDELRKLIGG